MKRRTIQITAVLLMGVLLCSGCLWAPGLERLKDEISAQLPGAQFDKEVALTLGPMSLLLARIATRFVPDREAQEAREYLCEMRRIELAVYKTGHLPSLDGLQFPVQLNDLLEEGWEIAATVREEHELVWVLYHQRGDEIDCLCAVVLDEQNLVLAKIRGNLGTIFLKGLREAEIFKDT